MKKRLTGLLLTAVMLLLCVFAPLKQDKITEAKTAVMKSLGVKWDLKENKWVKIRSNFAGNVWVDREATIKDLKIKDAKKEGYKKLTCTVFVKKEKPSQSQISQVAKSKFFKKNERVCNDNNHKIYSGGTTSSIHFGSNVEANSASVWVCDYNTGAALDGDDNEFDVDCTCKLSYGSSKYNSIIKNGIGYEWEAFDVKYKFTVIYPEDYKGLCIGVSGNGSYKKDVFAGKSLWRDDDDDKWDDGGFYISDSGKVLSKSPVYKKDKDNIHFIRIK